MKRALVILLALCCCLLSGCTDRSSSSRRSTKLIVQPGNYPAPSGRWIVNVSKQGPDIHYSVASASGGKPVFTAGGFSNSQRWFFFWDTQDRLWTFNSDMGPFAIWSDDGTGTWIQTSLTPSSAPAIPADVYDGLPKDYQRRFKR